jgi:hypothetical protein
MFSFIPLEDIDDDEKRKKPAPVFVPHLSTVGLVQLDTGERSMDSWEKYGKIIDILDPTAPG